MSKKANSNFVCPVCGKSENEYEEGMISIYSGMNSPYDLQVITVRICSDCTTAAFETIKRDLSPKCYKQEYYC